MPIESKIFLAAAAVLLVLNVITFIVYALDKHYAQTGHRRISEKNLLLLALFGGSTGALFGMTVVRHKTKHIKFLVLIPLFLLIHIAIIFYAILQMPTV